MVAITKVWVFAPNLCKCSWILFVHKILFVWSSHCELIVSLYTFGFSFLLRDSHCNFRFSFISFGWCEWMCWWCSCVANYTTLSTNSRSYLHAMVLRSVFLFLSYYHYTICNAFTVRWPNQNKWQQQELMFSHNEFEMWAVSSEHTKEKQQKVIYT